MGLSRSQSWRLVAVRGWRVGVPVFLALALVLAVVVQSNNYIKGGYAYNSDDLYPAAFCRGALGHTVSMVGFHLPGAPYLFPDLAVLIPLAWVISNVALLHLAYSLLYFAALVAIMTWIARSVGFQGREAFLLAASGTLVLVALHACPPYMGRGHGFIIPGSHMGAVLVGLYSTAMVFSRLESSLRWYQAPVFVLVGAVAAFSDKLLLVQFLAPLSLALMVGWLFRFVRLKMVLMNAVCTFLVYWGSLLVKNIALRLGFVLLVAEDHLSFDRCQESLERFLSDLPVLLQGQWLFLGFVFLYAIVASLIILAECASFAKTLRGKSPCSTGTARNHVFFLAVFTVAAWVSNLSAVIILGIWECSGHERYLLFLCCVPFLFTGIFLCSLRWRPVRTIQRVWVGGVTALALYLLAGQLPALHLENFQPAYPELAQALDRLAAERGIRFGFAPFWTARKISFLTRADVHILPLVADGCPFLHADNPNAFLDSDPAALSIPQYQFLIMPLVRDGRDNGHDDTEFFDPKRILSEYGEPAEIQIVGQDEIWLYERIGSAMLHQFLNGLLADHCRKMLAFSKPSVPAELGLPKHSYQKASGRGVVPIRADQEVEVQFSGPARGRTLDFSALHQSAFEVQFYRGQVLLGKLEVPPISWGIAWFDSLALQPRLLPLPASVRDEPFDRAVVRLKDNGNHSSRLGHFLVYQQDLGQPWPGPVRPIRKMRFEGETLPSFDYSNEIVSDPRASGRKARQAFKDYSGILAFGPFFVLNPGKYRVDFALKTTSPAPATPIARIEVAHGPFAKIISARDLVGQDLESRMGRYRNVSLNVETKTELTNVQFIVSVFGQCPVAVDYVEMTNLSQEP